MVAGAFTTLSAGFRRLLEVRAPIWLRPTLVFTIVAATSWAFILIPGKAPDFTVFWAAARHIGGPVYDADFITAAQSAIAPPGPRPFAYPPPFLLVLAPFGFLPFKAAYVLWVALTTTLLVEAAGRLTRWPWLILISPTLMFAILIGQSTMLVGALLAFAFAASPRPIVSGVLFGLAACIKPQVALLVPILLVLAGGWRGLLAFAATGLLVCGATALILGPHAWSDWIAALRDLMAINDALRIPRLGSAPLWLKAVVGLLAIVVIVDAVRRKDTALAMLATAGGALLISPHAPFYDAAILLAPALALVWRAELRSLPAAAMLLTMPLNPQVFGGMLALTALPFLRRPISSLRLSRGAPSA